MLDYFESIDRFIVLSINSWNSPFLDEVMWVISGKITWIPLYLLIFYLAYKKLGLVASLKFAVFVVLTIVMVDIISVYCFKEVFQRYRPSHNLLIKDQIHLYQISEGNRYGGGQYGFVSSHAANFFAITTCFFLVLGNFYKKFFYFLVFISLIVCYSRLYLGVHYLSDVICGGLLGVLIASLVHRFVWKKIN